HLVGVFLEAIFPVLVVIAFSIHQKTEDFGNFPVFHHWPQPNYINVVERDLHFQTAGFNLKEIKLLDIGANGPAADLFNNTYAMIGINNFIADLKRKTYIHETPGWKLSAGERPDKKHYKLL